MACLIISFQACVHTFLFAYGFVFNKFISKTEKNVNNFLKKLTCFLGRAPSTLWAVTGRELCLSSRRPSDGQQAAVQNVHVKRYLHHRLF